MGRWRAIIPIVLALVIATGGSVYLYKWLQSRTAPVKVVRTVKAEAVPVVVAAVDLNWGTKIQRQMLKTTPFFKQSLPSGYSSDPAQLVGRVVISPIKTNEAVLDSRLAPKSVTMGGISAVVKPGMRAVAVSGDKVSGIAGLIQPGNRVDVLVTIKDPKTKKEITKMVLSDILVLATGTQMQGKPDGKPSPVDVYTLEVKPAQGEKLALASNLGRLQFALRNLTDTKTVFTNGATIPETLASLRGPRPKPAVTRKVKVKRWVPRHRSLTVETIKGDKVSRQRFSF